MTSVKAAADAGPMQELMNSELPVAKIMTQSAGHALATTYIIIM
jgi:hypothetical protein